MKKHLQRGSNWFKDVYLGSNGLIQTLAINSYKKAIYIDHPKLQAIGGVLRFQPAMVPWWIPLELGAGTARIKMLIYFFLKQNGIKGNRQT